MPKKQKLAIIALSSCEGCQFAILDLGKKFLKILRDFELVEFSLIEDEPDLSKYDICLVEGSVITKEDDKKLRSARKKSKILVSLGACACVGGVPERINPKIRPLKELVKIDLEIPGCPPNNKEIFKMLYELKLGKIPKIPQKPVCSECPLLRQGKCFLLQKKLCLGSITLAGCEAICLKSNYRCEGCRGPIKNKEIIKNTLKFFNKIATKKEITHLIQKFGLEQEIYED